MFKSHLKSAWRNITRHRGYSFINVLGLALGIGACIAIFTITHYELTFDDFHPGGQNIYRVLGAMTDNNGNRNLFASTPHPVASAVRGELTGLDAIAGIIPYRAGITIPAGPGIDSSTRHFSNPGPSSIGIAEPSWFSVFHYDWLAGNPATALNEPNTVVLLESKARLYFGSGPLTSMLGRIVLYDDSLRVRITGIVKDWNSNTDLAFSDFISAGTLFTSFLKGSLNPDSWGPGDLTTWTFAKLSHGTKPAMLSAQLAALIQRKGKPGEKLSLSLQPLRDLHFNAAILESNIRTAHMPTLYALMGIAGFILLIAIVNFINLSTAQSIRRAKEVGVRKVLGGSRVSLVTQFITETFLLVVLAVFLANLLVNPALNAFRAFIPAGIVFHPLDPSNFGFLLALTLLTCLLAGFYPAKISSAQLPVISLKGDDAHKGGRKWYLRKSLIVFQFTVSLVFIIGSIIIGEQLRFIRHKDLGFKTEAIVIVGTPGGDSLSKVKVVAERLRQLAGIVGVAMQWTAPVDRNPRGMSIKFKSGDTKLNSVGQVDGDEGLLPLYHIHLLAGRNLAPSDSVKEFVINESCYRIMGCRLPEEAIGRTIYWNDRPYPVVGVVADFHGSSLHEPIRPLCIINRVERESNLAIGLETKGQDAHALTALLNRIEKIWKNNYPAGTFQFSFFDESIALLYEKDKQTASLMNAAMFITIFISCIGLFGLAMFSAETRIKEIGIRKVLGASVVNIAVMLGKDVVILIAIGALIASPIAWYVTNQWLAGFAYRIAIPWWSFLLGGLSALFMALATVSYQSIRAALVNPVRNLRSE